MQGKCQIAVISPKFTLNKNIFICLHSKKTKIHFLGCRSIAIKKKQINSFKNLDSTPQKRGFIRDFRNSKTKTKLSIFTISLYYNPQKQSFRIDFKEKM